MYKNILVPIAMDHNPHLSEAFDAARALVEDGGKITAINVVETVPSYVAQYLPENQAEVTRNAVTAEMKAQIGATDGMNLVVVTGHAGQSIVEYADEHDVDCIVIASHRPGMKDFFLGSTAARVVRHAHCAVHVIR